MNPSRRDTLKQLGAAGVGFVLSPGLLSAQESGIVIAGQPVDVGIDIGLGAPTPRTVRLRLRPLELGQPKDLPFTGALDDASPALSTLPVVRRRPADLANVATQAGDHVVRFTPDPPTFVIETKAGVLVQRLTLSADAPTMTFRMPSGPLLGLGEGGVQFDKRGSTDQMRNGQVTSRADGYGLNVNGTRAPVQWLIGTGDGWAMFIHQPYGSFDFKGSEGRFSLPVPPVAAPTSVVSSTVTADPFLPLDVFIVSSDDPAVIMREYARITGLPAMPPPWSLGYLQSHRTLAGREAILQVARTFREKKLPCDGLIYLGTDFAPSGWNTHNGEFTWHPANFPDPPVMIDELHREHFKVVLHIVVEGHTLTGRTTVPGTHTLARCAADPLPPGRTPDDHWPPDRVAACYWPAHKALMDVGVDGWWPDQGDGFDGPSRFRRHEMYFEGSQAYRPNERPFALHRNASPGVQRFGSYIWSGDVQSRWDTLKAHVPIGINAGLSGLPYWGTDIGGFYGTAEYTGELFVRWFQFGAFCPLFRSHGRNWHLHLPWGWDGGDGGPPETQGFVADPAELHNARVEVICRKYLELRSRLMPYLYTAVRDACDSGLPIMRALWLHDPTDPEAVRRGDQYLWGPDLLVAPVVEKGATSRRLYLPRGRWVDFWTNESLAGGREIDRPVDLDTVPLYVRAGAIVPMGPVRQYVDEPSPEAPSLVVYPGADGTSDWYEDDGHVVGPSMRIRLAWRDGARTLSVALAPGSRMRPPSQRRLDVRIAGAPTVKSITFNGQATSVRL
jgi:alpha-glucosidase/alpha-D-xyloside xylohydrolase